MPSRKSGSEVQVQGEVTRLSSPRLICFTEAKKMMAVMENITKLVRANKFTLDTVPLLSWFEDLVYTGLHSLHVYHVSKSNAFTTSSHIQGRSLAILGNIYCQLSMVRIKAVCSLPDAFCDEEVLYKVGEDAISDAFGRAADASDSAQVVLIFPTLREEYLFCKQS